MFAFMFGKTKKRIVPIYLSGVNKGDNVTYEGSMQKDMTVSLRNWYMDGYFGEARMNLIGGTATAVIILVALGMVAGTMIGGM
jgi:ech hydrogenase subunit A